MLDREDDQHQHHADPEHGVEREADRPERAAVECPVADGRRTGCGQRRDGVGRGPAGIGRIAKPGNDLGRALGEAGDRRQRTEDVGRGDGAAERQHRRPGQPVAPHRERRDELRIAQPGRRAIDRRTARLGRKQAGDLGIGEGLDQPENDRAGPDDEGELARRSGNAADREQHQRGHAAGDPERTSPVDGPVQLARAWTAGRHGSRTHCIPSPCAPAARSRLPRPCKSPGPATGFSTDSIYFLLSED